jgi:cytidyltransferase-like protein
MSRRVLTLGTFDIPHAGHAAFLRRCAEYGDLLVGVNSDHFVREYRGEEPVYDERERLRLIRGMGYAAVTNDGPGAALIEEQQPDLLVIGSDWLRRDYLAQIGVPKPTFPILFLPYTEGISTTDIKRRLAR